MIDNLLDTIKGSLIDQLGKNTNADSNQLGDITQEVTSTFKEGLINQFSAGNLGDIVGLFNKEGSQSPMASMLSQKTVSNLISKLGISESISKQIATFAVPFLIEKFGVLLTTNGKNNESGINELIGDLTGGTLKNQLLGGLGKKLGF